jgi:hypothetical protein
MRPRPPHATSRALRDEYLLLLEWVGDAPLDERPALLREATAILGRHRALARERMASLTARLEAFARRSP